MVGCRQLLWLCLLFLCVACSGGGTTSAGCPDGDGATLDEDAADAEVTLPDADTGEKDEKDISDMKDEGGSDDTVATDEDADATDEDAAVTDDDGLLPDGDGLLDDSDSIVVPCFEKPCGAHGECDHLSGACEAYFHSEEYACAPAIEDFGYRGTEECVEVNCAQDGDCREDLGYICLQFGAPSDDFNGASSACLRSLSGADCAEEGKKVCQFGKDIAIACTEGVWKPYFCEEGWFCDTGECLPEPLDSDAVTPDADVTPPVEICDGEDNNGDGNTDEGCDDDGDGWCDINMLVYGTPTVCPNGTLDCDDGDPNIYPGSTVHQEAIDYDCDNRKEYQATMVLSVDDELVELCANGRQFDKDSEFGPYYGNWAYADTYGGPKLVLESGTNVVGIHGKDTGLAISAFVSTIQVNGLTIVSDGVLPPADSIPYEPGDPEWTEAQWRYFPEAVPTPNADWCDKWFDDGDWGPAILAGKEGTDPSVYGNLGTNPWWGGACGLTQYERCPTAFESYYTDGIEGNEPKWIWDYNPTQLADAWLRIRIVLP